MPHRTVFQIGENHAHPFTMFVGGFVIGTLVTGAIAWAWVMADDTDIDVENVVIPQQQSQATASPASQVSPSASPTVTF